MLREADTRQRQNINMEAAKFLMFAVNFLVELAGLVVLGVGMSWYLKVELIVNLFGKTNDLLSIVLVVIGGLAAIVAFLGCYGAFAETIWMLAVFALINIMLLCGELACVVLLFLKKDLLEHSFKHKAPENYQWIFTGFCVTVGALEIIATVFAFHLAQNIRKGTKNRN